MFKDLRCITNENDFIALRANWDAILAQSFSNCFYMTWDWVSLWWQVFATSKDKLCIFVWEQDNVIKGIAPFYIVSKKIASLFTYKQLAFMGTRPPWESGDIGSDYMDIMCNTNDKEEFLSKIVEYIKKNKTCNEVYVTRLDTESSTLEFLQRTAAKYNWFAVRDENYASPFIKLPTSWDEYIGSLSANMRQKIRNQRRKLEKREGVEYKTAQTPQEVDTLYKELIHLHQLRWTSRGKGGCFSAEKFTMFHGQIMQKMLAKNRLMLTVLYDGGKAKAALYSAVYNNKIYFYQSGINTKDSELAYGYLLHSHCIEKSIQMGLLEYDFLPKGNGDDYKDRFTNATRYVSSVQIACSKWYCFFLKSKEKARFAYRWLKKNKK